MTHCHILTQPVSVSGHGLHTGKPVTVTLRPLPENLNHGFWAHRTDCAGTQPFQLAPTCVQATQLRTEIISPDTQQSIQTVEHLLAALAASGVWNTLIEVDGPEVPLLGGGSAEWLEALHGQRQPSKTVVPYYAVSTQTVAGKSGQRAVITSHTSHKQGFSVTAHVVFEHPMIGAQSYTYTHGATNFATEIAPCRTFALEADVLAAQAAGLIQGGTLAAIQSGETNSAVVYGTEGPHAGKVLNPTGLHFPDEAVRHKVLDILGDFAIAGALPNAHIEIWMPGHGFNNHVLRSLLVK